MGLPADADGLDFIACPECGLPAEVVGDFTLGSTHGPSLHLVTMCIGGHWLTPRIETVADAAGARLPAEAEAE